jgi:hypothetical protein
MYKIDATLRACVEERRHGFHALKKKKGFGSTWHIPAPKQIYTSV